MKQNEALYSQYLIDGIETDNTPAELLRDYGEACVPEEACPGQIVDESLDPNPKPSTFRQSQVAAYIDSIMNLPDRFPTRHPRSGTKTRVAVSLIDTLWLDGHFRLGNLRISPKWRWSDEKTGNMAAFYQSVEALCEYVSEMGLKVEDYAYEESSVDCHLDIDVRFSPVAPMEEEEADEIVPGKKRSCPDRVRKESDSWIVYVPFDTCPYRLGASALSAFAGNGADNAPEVQDADYFIDCYEVIREMVEDGIAMSGVTVGKGGLMTAAARLCAETGTTLDVSGIASSYDEANTARILFGEIPGVLVQFSDIDFDYIDSQFLLQDIAYYPLGHPDGIAGQIGVRHSRKPAVAGILGALLGQASEGED